MADIEKLHVPLNSGVKQSIKVDQLMKRHLESNFESHMKQGPDKDDF